MIHVYIYDNCTSLGTRLSTDTECTNPQNNERGTMHAWTLQAVTADIMVTRFNTLLHTCTTRLHAAKFREIFGAATSGFRQGFYSSILHCT